MVLPTSSGDSSDDDRDNNSSSNSSDDNSTESMNPWDRPSRWTLHRRRMMQRGNESGFHSASSRETDRTDLQDVIEAANRRPVSTLGLSGD